ncbi:MAG TPA: hypothetical protein VGK90_10890, partial [Rhizomicrobium sp.]
AESINDKGMITGYYTDPTSGDAVGFVRSSAGKISTFALTKVIGTFAAAINSKGTIAGYYEDTGGELHGFVRSK